MGRLAKLLILDASSNELESVPQELDGCAALSDLHLSSNHLVDLPDSVGASRRVSSRVALKNAECPASSVYSDRSLVSKVLLLYSSCSAPLYEYNLPLQAN